MDKDSNGIKDVDWTAVEEAMADIFRPPQGLSERIMAAVNRDGTGAGKVPEISVRRPGKYSAWIRFSAAAAVICVFAALTVSLAMFSRGGASAELAEEMVPVKSYRLDTPLATAESGHKDVSGAMPVRLTGVSSAGGSSASGVHRRAHIAPAVRHVWLVPDIAEAEALIKRIAEENEKNISVAGKKNGGIVYSSGLKDTELQNLVNLLYEEGWSLVTPDYPQPREEGKTSLSGHGVNYELVLLENKEVKK